MAQREPEIALVVCERNKNHKAAGVIFAGKEYKIGERFSAPQSDANYLISSGRCAKFEGKAPEVKK